MSYRNPRYTYVSSQPAYERMQQQFTQAAATMSSKIEAEKKRGEELAAKGRAGSQAYITKAAEYNSVGNQSTRGAVGDLFKDTGARVGELIRLTQGANPQCVKDGNCEALQDELAQLEKGPATIKNFITNLSDQLDYDSIENFYAGQNASGVLASNILSGKSGFNQENGYSYSFEKSGGNSYDIVFKSKDAEFYDPETGEYSNEMRLNSAAFEDYSHNNKSYFAGTPTVQSQVNSILGDAGGAGIYKYDKDGKRSGTYDISKFLEDPLLATSYEISPSNKEGVADTYYGVVSLSKLKDDNRIMGAISSQLEGFIGDVNSDIAGEDDGEARSFYDMVLRNQTDLNSFDVDLMKSTLTDVGTDITDLGDDEVKKLFTETMQVFDENGKTAQWDPYKSLTTTQKKLFSALYTNHMLGQIRDEMMNDFESRKLRINPDSSKFINPNNNQDFNTRGK